MNVDSIADMKRREEELTIMLKCLMDKDANFVKPFSEFWKGCTYEQCPSAFGCYGLWLSGEGASKINGKDVANYYDAITFHGSYDMIKFMEKYDLYLTWYDPGTIMVLFKN